MAAVIAAAVVIKLKFADKVREYLSRYEKAFQKENRGKFIQGAFYYLFHNAFLAVMYFFCLKLIMGDTLPVSDIFVMRISSIIADITGFLIGKIWLAVQRAKAVSD